MGSAASTADEEVLTSRDFKRIVPWIQGKHDAALEAKNRLSRTFQNIENAKKSGEMKDDETYALFLDEFEEDASHAAITMIEYDVGFFIFKMILGHYMKSHEFPYDNFVLKSFEDLMETEESGVSNVTKEMIKARENDGRRRFEAEEWREIVHHFEDRFNELELLFKAAVRTAIKKG